MHRDFSISRRNLIGVPAGAFKLALIVSALLFANDSRAGSIFDEDWVPPPPRAVVVAPATQPLPAAAAPGTPGTPSAPEGTVPTAPSADPAAPATPRRPVPSAAEQARSRALMKAVYAEDLKNKSAAARELFAQKLIEAATAVIDNPSDQFVLLNGAVTAAQEAASLRLCMAATDRLADAYAIDRLAAMLAAAQGIKLRSDRPATTRENLRAGLELLDQLADAEEFAGATRLIAALQPAAVTDPKMKAALAEEAKAIEPARQAQARAAPQMAKLKASPDDPAANAAVGTYFCFFRGQWDQGVPLLAKGSDAVLQALAKRDLANPSEPDKQLDLGTAWWDAAEKAPDDIRKGAMRTRAAAWYERAKPGLPAGLGLELATRRIAEAPPPGNPGGRKIDLLKILDLKRDVIQGNWSLQDGTLRCASGNGPQMRFPYRPPAEYDFVLEFAASPGHYGLHQLFARGDAGIDWALSGNRDPVQICRFGPLSKERGAGPTAPFPFKDGQRYVSRVEVRRGEIRGYIDDELKVTFKTDYSDFKPDANLLGDPTRLGLAHWWNTLTVYRAEVTEVTGRGTVLTDSPKIPK